MQRKADTVDTFSLHRVCMNGTLCQTFIVPMIREIIKKGSYMKYKHKIAVFGAILMLAAMNTSCTHEKHLPDSVSDTQTSATVSELVSAMEEPDYTITTTQQEWNDQIYTIYKMKTDTYEEILEPPLSERILEIPVPAFLNEEQQLLYLRAYSIYPTFSGYPENIDDSYPRKDGEPFDDWSLYSYKTPEDTIPMYYYAAQGRYEKWDDFISMGTSIFTSEYFNSLSKYFWNNDGHTYIPDFAKGYAWGYIPHLSPDTYELISMSDNEIHFEVIGHYYNTNHPEDEDPDSIVIETRSFPITMILTEKGWRFSEFHMAGCDI